MRKVVMQELVMSELLMREVAMHELVMRVMVTDELVMHELVMQVKTSVSTKVISISKSCTFITRASY